MNDNTKLEVAIEIMASKIASAIRAGHSEKGNYLNNLLQEKAEMYNLNEAVIDKIINVYGKELKR